MHDLPEAIDLSHHLSHLARERLQSPLKVRSRGSTRSASPELRGDED